MFRNPYGILVESAEFPHKKSPCLLVEMLVSHHFWYPMIFGIPSNPHEIP
jgi:hypothetical protein